jgi:hypothetical protein
MLTKAFGVGRGGKRTVAALVLAPLVLAAMPSGVAASAAKAAPPTPLTGRWARPDWGDALLFVRPRGKVEIRENGWYHARFKGVTGHRLRISGIPSCSGTGTYRWTITNHQSWSQSYQLKLTKIHDACKLRVNLLAARTWWRPKPIPPPLP